MITFAPPENGPISAAAPGRAVVWFRVTLAVALLAIAMTATAVIAPEIALRTSATDHPGYTVIAGTGVVVIVLSSVFLACVRRFLGLGLAWLVLTLLTNALVVVGKFVLAPIAFYQTTFVRGGVLDVTSQTFVTSLAAGLALVYCSVIVVVYVSQRDRVMSILRPNQRRVPPPTLGVLLILLSALVSPLTIPVVIQLPWYVGVLVAGTGGAALLVITAALVFGGAAVREVARTSVSLRNVTILTAAFWVTLAIVLVYHAVWAVFMTILVTLWPLKTISPSGK